MIIEIHKSPSADSRTADKNHPISFDEFSKSTDMHREDVKNTMYELARMIKDAGDLHDWTKKEREEQFYEEFTKHLEVGDKFDFKKADWYQYHITNERHHINSYVHDDINLLDVLEMIADCCCAGLARSGQIYDLKIDPKVLMKAFDNTCELVKSKLKVVDDTKVEKDGKLYFKETE